MKNRRPILLNILITIAVCGFGSRVMAEGAEPDVIQLLANVLDTGKPMILPEQYRNSAAPQLMRDGTLLVSGQEADMSVGRDGELHFFKPGTFDAKVKRLDGIARPRSIKEPFFVNFSWGKSLKHSTGSEQSQQQAPQTFLNMISGKYFHKALPERSLGFSTQAGSAEKARPAYQLVGEQGKISVFRTGNNALRLEFAPKSTRGLGFATNAIKSTLQKVGITPRR